MTVWSCWSLHQDLSDSMAVSHVYGGRIKMTVWSCSSLHQDLVHLMAVRLF